MIRMTAYLFGGLCLTSCASSVPALDPAPSLVGRWEQQSVHYLIRNEAGLVVEDAWRPNDPNSILLELTADSVVNMVFNGVITPTGTTYAYQPGKLIFRGPPEGETVHRVLTVNDHQLVYRSFMSGNFGTRQLTFRYKR